MAPPAEPSGATLGLSVITANRYGQWELLPTYLRTAERVTIPRASHGVHLENPADFNRAVLEFVGHH